MTRSSERLDVLASQKEMWRSIGRLYGANPYVSRSDVEGMRRLLDAQSGLLQRTSPVFAAMSRDIAEAYVSAAEAAMSERGD